MKVGLAIAGSAFGFVGAAGAQSPGFWLMGLAPSATQGFVKDLSLNGSTAVGATGGTSIGSIGFTWTRAGGRDDFGLRPGMPSYTTADGVSSDGSTLVGRMISTTGQPIRAYRWTGAGLLQDLGLLAGEERAYATGISGDGSVVVGGCEHSPSGNAFGQAFRWTESGMQGLGYLRPNGTLSIANAISRDGSTIVGVSQSNGTGGPTEGFVWTQGGEMQGLPVLPGSASFQTIANAVNADGTVVAGYRIASNGRPHAARWTSAGVTDLGVLPGMFDSFAYAASDDGEILGGTTNLGSNHIAFLWTPSMGMVDLNIYLANQGLTLPSNYTLTYVYAISGDGLTFAGQARNLTTGTLEGFVATVPSPASILILTLPALMRRRRAPRHASRSIA